MSWSAGDCRALFQSTLPVWGATLALIFTRQPRSNFNPRSPCGERPCNGARRRQGIDFNPRSPCGERHQPHAWNPPRTDFNPRSPCGERPGSTRRERWRWRFQSTLPVWGATHEVAHDVVDRLFQSTLPVWGATPLVSAVEQQGLFQSTLPVWGATWSVTQLFTLVRFQSTLPVWGATLGVEVDLLRADISIHAPRVGSDAPHLGCRGERANFNPRSPCGERLVRMPFSPSTLRFQSTLPVWGATLAPLSMNSGARFQSTLPVWGATRPSAPLDLRPCISIHAPRVGSDAAKPSALVPVILFQSTLPVWGATRPPHRSIYDLCHFNPRSPCGERPVIKSTCQLSM